MLKRFFKTDNKTVTKSSVLRQSDQRDGLTLHTPSSMIHAALQLHQAGRLEDADAAYREILSVDPDNFDALHLSGVVAYQLGMYEKAVERISRALSREPSNAVACNNLGVVHKAQRNLDAALNCFSKALALQPEYADAHTNLFDTHVQLGNTLRQGGEIAAAGDHYRQALGLKPNSAVANVNFGNVLNEQGKSVDAIVFYERAIALDSSMPEGHLNLGNAYKECGRTDEAVGCYRRTLALQPDWADAYYLLGNALKEQDDLQGMLDCYRKAISLKPRCAEARWALAMCQIPAVYQNESEPALSRAQFSRELERLERWLQSTSTEDVFRAVGVMQPFLLAYQEEDNRALLERYGSLCAKTMSQWFDRQSIFHGVKRRPSTPIKVGVVSQHYFNHSVWNAIVKGWFQHLDRSHFSLHAFYLGTREDEATRYAQAYANHFEMGRRELRQWVAAILNQRLDVLLYPEIGMDPMTARLASLRLAPVQAASWGHPETTGLPTIDYYLSAEDLEPENAQAYYSERLITLPHLGCFYEPVPVAPIEPALHRYDLEASTPILVCPGVPFKYAPQYDRVLTEIAHRLGRCRFLFFTHRLGKISQKLQQRLERVFSRDGLDSGQFISFIPWQNSPEFHGWLRGADVFLDTIGFSGFNTAIQGLQCGIPIVTREGRFMRGRLASGILKRMGLTELVAHSEEEYIALAVQLARDVDYRVHLRGRIENSRSILFQDIAPVRALEDFFIEVTLRH